MERRSLKLTKMTEGNLFWNIILFALPVMATTAMQQLYVTIDLMTVHVGDSAESMGAIASNNALINLIIVVFVGISLGVNVIFSQAKGAGDKEKCEKVLHTSLIFAFLSGLLVGVVGFLISDNLLEMMGTEAHYLEKATLYLRIYFCGLPFLMVYNYLSQLFRAQGDSNTPFIILAISGVINVAFDCWFVFGFKASVAGVGFATIIAEAVSAILGIILLWKKKNLYVNLSFKKLKMDMKSLQEIIIVGLPSGLQGFFFSLPNVFIQSSLYTIDPNNIALENGAIASGSVEVYFFTVIDAIGTSVMTFVAANLGAKNKENIKKVILYGSIWGIIACALVAIITLFLYKPLLRIFVDTDAEIDSGRRRLWVMGFWYIFNFGMNMTASTLKGMRKTMFPMLTTLIFCTGVRILLIYTLFQLEQFHTLEWLYALFPITWVLAFVCNTIFLLIVTPKVFKKFDENPAKPDQISDIPEAKPAEETNI